MKKKVFPGVLLVLLVTGSVLYPFETTTVPAWTLRITDEDGVPYGALRVVEYWKHYSLELDGGENGEERWTDQNGVVQFPPRKIRAGLLSRMFRTAITSLSRLMHGSVGIHAYIIATGPQGVTSIHYETDKPLPDKLVLPRAQDRQLK
jgi:hypothetical protein